MRIINFLTLVGAIALAATACNKEQAVDNPNYNPETNEVNTHFVFNVVKSTATKQTADAVQASTSETFRGIEKAVLLAYKLGTNGSIVTADANADKYYDLAEVVSAGSAVGTTDHSRRVLEMALPINTNTLLFYGKAIKGAKPSGWASVSDDDYFGKMKEYFITGDAGSANFQLAQRLEEGTANNTKYHNAEKTLAGILSCIMNTNLSGTNHVALNKDDTPSGISTKYKFDVATTEYGEISFADYAIGTNSPVETGHVRYMLEEKLCEVYKAMTTIKQSTGADGELRAGSAYSIQRTMADMWTVANEVRCAEPVSVAEAVAKYFGSILYNEIDKYFAGTTNTEALPITNVVLENTSIIKDILPTDNFWPTSTPSGYKPASTDIENITTTELSGFPLSFNIPMGGAHYQFDATTKCFSYVSNFNTSGMGVTPGSGGYNINSYYYPAELMYFGNSPIRTSDKEHKVADYPDGTITWETGSSWNTDWVANSSVQASTRSVAMSYNINYGTALLSTQVQYKVGTLKDNNHAIQDARYFAETGSHLTDDQEKDKEILVNDGSFILTGIIIGGQPVNVGWDYLPVNFPGSSAVKYGFIYDRCISTTDPNNAQKIPGTGVSKPAYTAVLDNYRATGPQDKVYVALEFQNKTGADFYGNANIIRNDGYFYLIGELDPAGKDWPVTENTTYQIPPFDTSTGKSAQVPRIFIQDCVTTVTFSLGTNSLKYAYLTVPDLRSSSMTVGLSVDMAWRTGLNFTDVILGGN
ncbi:MAG: hypothetical protein J6W82_04905 [Bacteroidales bacterium]|nr:hypothetical protein [Bacteroidales bacterium]